MGCTSSTPGPLHIKTTGYVPTTDELSTYVQAQGPFFRTKPDEVRPILYASTGVAAKDKVPSETAIAVLRRAVAKHSDSPAMMVERPCPPLDSAGKAPPPLPPSEWTAWTYQQYWDECREIGKGLIALGVQRMEGVCVYGFNGWVCAGGGAWRTLTPPRPASPEWLMSQTSICMVGWVARRVHV
jgi:hypothetical protein